MATKCSYKLSLNNAWRRQLETNLQTGLDNFANSILTQAVSNAPKLTGALRKSGKVTNTGGNARVVSFGNSQVKYAVRRHFENYKNPQTLYYLQRAAEAADSRFVSYFKRIK